MSEQYSRRQFLRITSGGLLLATAMPKLAVASMPDQPRSLALNNLHTGEWLETCYFDGNAYLDEELARIDHLCRDFRLNEVHPMDRRLFDRLTQIQKLVGTENEVQIISGYRSPQTNEALRAKSSGVAKKSYHMLGQAIDFRLDGVKLATIRDAALSLNAGGVGYYPGSNFIHIDTGPVRSW
ncbi:DUF882 domain-containing protein [Vibrio sp. IRLE0018]|uniref:DUF882 domain-containing protein n=1 Tax=Vibrio TaxID=662 RepID=UPI0015946E35|nr:MULTISPECIES: DUF882 domain-containing protein [Vibrio]MCF8778983.1 DUF882 domain-containing protein [Vibrio floridensis]